MINITPAAIEKLKGVLAEEGEGDSLRVLVMPGGHGLQYMLTAENAAEATEEDVVEDMGGLKVIMDLDSIPLLEGAKIDYVEELARVGFVISNPNAQTFGGGCACGGNCGCGAAESGAQNQTADACDCGDEHGQEHTH